MKRSLLVIGAIILSLLIITGCNETSSPEELTPQIRGTIYAPDGNIVQDAKIMFTYKIDTLLTRPSTSINFTIEADSYVRLWVSHHAEGDEVRLLTDEMYPSGHHSIVWDSNYTNGTNVLPGYFDYHFQINEGHIQTKTILLLYGVDSTINYDLQESLSPLNNDGEYEVLSRRLPFLYSDNQFALIDDVGEEFANGQISNSVTVWAISPIYAPVSVPNVEIKLDETVELDLHFTDFLE